MSMKMMKWIAAGISGRAPAIGLARSHVTAAPLAAVSSVSSKTAPKKLAVTHEGRIRSLPPSASEGYAHGRPQDRETQAEAKGRAQEALDDQKALIAAQD